MCRKLEQEYKDGTIALRAELSKEVEFVQQQANQQQEELEKEMSKMKEEENFLREHLTLTIKVISTPHWILYNIDIKLDIQLGKKWR